MVLSKIWTTAGALTVAAVMSFSALAPAAEPQPSAAHESGAESASICVAALRPSNDSASKASGSAMLRIAPDEKSAVLSFQRSNLSSPETAIHIDGAAAIGDRGEARTILFDVAAAKPEPNGTYTWTFTANESNTVGEIVAAIKAGRTCLTIETETNPAGEISGFFRLSRAAQTSAAPTPPPPLASGTPSAADAARLLSQSTFGPTEELIRHVQKAGIARFLREQMETPTSSHLKFVDSSDLEPKSMRKTMSAWWTHAISAPDQLRQRVAFALSEIFVISVRTDALNTRPFAVANYVDVLANNAFANYRQLLEDVTLNPAMGGYLNMLHNDKGDPAKGRHPNENYAREVMQLFSIGLYRLNTDGSLKLDAKGFPIPAYDQRAVMGLAAVFTGWHFAQPNPPRWKGVPIDYRHPMRSVPSHHDTNAKTILDGVVLRANQTPEQDLKQALDVIFKHPNVGPFISRQLIQRLVTSNPSPAYLYRVASIFNNNGRGVRGDLAAVIRAILTDYEARGNAPRPEAEGHVREPVIRVTNLLRAFHASTPSGKFAIGQPGSIGQEPLHSPTVFNFFSPDYQPPGAIADSGLSSPEFQITTETTAVTSANFLQRAIFERIGPPENPISLDLTKEQALAEDPARLIDHLDLLLLSEAMSSEMRRILMTAIEKIPADDRAARAKTAIYLVINSPEFVVEK